MNKHEDEKLNVKRNKWRKMWPFWVAIWILFNPISILVLSVGLLTHQAETVTQRNNKINELFKEFCDGDEYVFYYTDNFFSFYNYKIGFFETHDLPYSIESNLDNIRYYFDDLLLYTESNYFFLVTSETKNSFIHSIAKTDLFFNNFEVVVTIGETTKLIDIKYQQCGLDNVCYFKLDETYYSFDFKDLSLKEIESNSREAAYFKMTRESFYESQGIVADNCNEENGAYCFSYNENEYQLDSSTINKNILSLLQEYKYFPKYHQSYPSGETSILFFQKYVFWDAPLGGYHPNCLIISFNRETDNIISYQAFANVVYKKYCFIHKATID